jgi:hypothetical protein
MISDFVLLILFFIAVVLFYWLFKRDVTYYYIEPNPGIDANFTQTTRRILLNSRVNQTHKIQEVLDKSDADVEIYLRERAEMEKMKSKKAEYYPGTNKKIHFSWTYQYPKPTIYIDGVNWMHGVEESKMPLGDYRRYVIQHEFMHALGYDHQPCNASTAVDGICPIMYQATRGCPPGFQCGNEILAVDYTKEL